MKKKENIDYFGDGVLGHCHSIRRKLLHFKGFHYATEKSWQDVEQILDEHNIEHHEAIIDCYSLDFHLNQTIYPSIHRESVVITLFSFFEHQLNDLCETIAPCLEDQIKFKDLKGQGIERAKLYLTKVAEFEWGEFSSWAYLKKVQKIRNYLVHNGGFLKDDDVTFIEENEYLKIERVCSGSLPDLNEEKRVIIESGFIDELIDNMELFFKQLGAEELAFVNKSPGPTPRRR